jgi:hypothetical protein
VRDEGFTKRNGEGLLSGGPETAGGGGVEWLLARY